MCGVQDTYVWCIGYIKDVCLGVYIEGILSGAVFLYVYFTTTNATQQIVPPLVSITTFCYTYIPNAHITHTSHAHMPTSHAHITCPHHTLKTHIQPPTHTHTCVIHCHDALSPARIPMGASLVTLILPWSSPMGKSGCGSAVIHSRKPSAKGPSSLAINCSTCGYVGV